MRRKLRLGLVVGVMSATMAFVTAGATPEFAHEGGHKGGCAEFGINGNVPQQGPIVSSFATQEPGVVADIVANVDHAACAS
jgi:hypothetical protein